MEYLVLIDSNAIIGNHYKLHTKNLEDFFRSNQLIIAEPSVKEIIKNYNKHQVEKEKMLQEAVRNATRFGIETELIDVKKNDFEGIFHEELQKLNALVLKNVEANIEFIFNKSILLKKPFKTNKGKETGGFRDVLIWDLWLNYLEENHDRFYNIIIVNSDTDFIDGYDLHKDLIEDLNVRNIPVDKIQIMKNFKSLTEFVINYQEYEQSMSSISREFMDNILSEIIEKVFSDGMEEEINKKFESHYPIEYEPFIPLIERAHNVYIDTMTGEKDDLYLYFTEDFTITVEYFMPKSDYYFSQLNNIEILDGNWNKWVMHVQENFTLQVGFEVNLDMVNNEILELDYYIDDNLQPFDTGNKYDDEEFFNERIKR